MPLFIILAVFLYIIHPRNIYSGASVNYPFISLRLPPEQHIIFEQGGSLCRYSSARADWGYMDLILSEKAFTVPVRG
jgi:hypothetical protein